MIVGQQATPTVVFQISGVIGGRVHQRLVGVCFWQVAEFGKSSMSEDRLDSYSGDPSTAGKQMLPCGHLMNTAH